MVLAQSSCKYLFLTSLPTLILKWATLRTGFFSGPKPARFFLQVGHNVVWYRTDTVHVLPVYVKKPVDD
eukprot:m.307735 g.307735  ORF g.307735 m.307735 type:complete len:69 (+) comp42737_c0_seq1:368-574(+)